MAGILHSTAADGLAVDTGSKAARASLWEAGGNRLTKVSGAAAAPGQEGLIISGVNDGNIRHLRTDRIGSLALASNTVLFTEPFEGTSLPSNRWLFVQSTMTNVQTAASGQQLNGGLITTINTGCFIRTLRTFSRLQRAPLHFKCRAKIASVTNSVGELGFGDVNTFNGPNTNGAYFQYTSGGVLQGVLTFNGVDVTTTPITGLVQTNFYTWDIIIDDDSITYIIQDTSTGQIVAERVLYLSATQARLWTSTRLFVFARLYNTASIPATAPMMVISSVDVVMLDATVALPWKEVLASNGHGVQVSPTGWTQTANWTNSTAPVNAVLSNTTPGYTTIGGNFSFAAVAGAVTDYVLFGFSIPSPYSFVCTGVDIETFNTGAAVATTATVLMWALGIDQSAVSLATAGIIRVPLGIQDLQVGAAIGARCVRISQNFDVPLVTNFGRSMTLILRMPIGTATGSQVIQGLVNIRGYYQ